MANFMTVRSPMLNSRNLLLLAVLTLLAPLLLLAQSGPPVSYTSVNELNNLLDQVKQTSQNIQGDLAKARIDRWKADSSTKRQAQANVESIQRNLQSALPEMIAQLNNSPEDLSASFKLYRNLDALYDVFAAVAESAGAFGSKDEFQNLSNDMNGLESARRAFGERVQRLAAAKEDELGRLRTQIKQLQAAPPPPPRKIVVDDTEPPKKPAKKKPAKPAAKPPTTTNPPPSGPPSK
jgi:prophage DNA circulation protein